MISKNITAATQRRRSRFARVDKSLYLMLLPGAIIVAIFSYGPLLGLQIAFKNYDVATGILGSPWVGLDNFKYMFSYPDFGRIIFNTINIASMKLVLRFFAPIVAALLLNELISTRYKRLVQTLIYLPHFISWVVVCGILITALSPTDGIVNTIITAFGGTPIYFLGRGDTFIGVLLASDVWKEFGYGTIIYMAALTGIDPSLYEAATIDRANRLQKVWYITLPGITPIMVLVGTLSIGSLMNAGFDQIFNLYNPMVYNVADVLDTFTYRMGIGNAQYSLATAIGMVTQGINAALVIASYFIAYKLADYRIF